MSRSLGTCVGVCEFLLSSIDEGSVLKILKILKDFRLVRKLTLTKATTEAMTGKYTKPGRALSHQQGRKKGWWEQAGAPKTRKKYGRNQE